MNADLMDRPQACVTPDVTAAYQRYGAVVLRGIDANLALPSPRARWSPAGPATTTAPSLTPRWLPQPDC